MKSARPDHYPIPVASHRTSPALGRIILVLLSMVMGLLAAEALARVMGLRPKFGPRFPLEGAPPRTVDGVVLWSVKAPRSDGQDIRRAASDRVAFKVLGLGDSIMYGVGQRKEDTYLEHARCVLAGRSSRPVEILNLAIPGYNTVQESRVYRELGDQIRPDLVIVHFWQDDAREFRVVGGYVFDPEIISEDGRLLVQAHPVPDRVNDFLLQHSRFYDLLTQVVVAHRGTATRDDASEWARVCEALADIQDRVRSAGGRMLVLASPSLNDASPRPNDFLSPLRQFALAHGIEIIDLGEWLHGVDVRDIAMDSCHFNAAGHHLIGERLAEYLLEHDLKPGNG